MRGPRPPADPRTAYRIAAGIDDALRGRMRRRTPDDSRLRDDYTSLMWLGGEQAPRLWALAPMPRRCSGAMVPPRARPVRAPRGSTGPVGCRQAGTSERGAAVFRAGRRDCRSVLRPPSARTAEPSAAALPAGCTGLADGRGTREVQRVATHAGGARSGARCAIGAQRCAFSARSANSGRAKGQHVLVAELARNLGRRDLGVMAGRLLPRGRIPRFPANRLPADPGAAGV